MDSIQNHETNFNVKTKQVEPDVIHI